MMLSDTDRGSSFAMHPAEFEQIRRMIYDFCGVDLSGKQVLVGTRLGKKVRDLGFPSFGNFCEHLRKDPSGDVFAETVDLLTTNHTSFFREQQHFDFLRHMILPELPQAAPLAVWSAACSTGEEPYTIAFSLVEALGEQAQSRVSVLATDISTRALAQARRGVYSLASVQHLSAGLRRSYLLKGTGQYADKCLVKREIRSWIDFRRFNLLDDCTCFGPFQVIFCRNVMIYFDQKTQEAVVNKLASRLVPGGYLLIGHSESLNRIEHPLRYVAPAIYRQPRESDALFGLRRFQKA